MDCGRLETSPPGQPVASGGPAGRGTKDGAAEPWTELERRPACEKVGIHYRPARTATDYELRNNESSYLLPQCKLEISNVH